MHETTKEPSSNLLEKPTLLHDVGNGLHLDTFGLVDVLERIQLPRLLVLDDPDLDGASHRLAGGE